MWSLPFSIRSGYVITPVARVRAAAPVWLGAGLWLLPYDNRPVGHMGNNADVTIGGAGLFHRDSGRAGQGWEMWGAVWWPPQRGP